jgi:dTDP-4-amino-4,6-dideoxygalactose transaminase
MINLFEPYVPKEVISGIGEVLYSRWIGQGPKVELFEKEFEKFFNVQYAVSMNSGTSALETAYDLVGISKDDEVITTPLTCTATNIPLLHRKAKIIWADINPKTLCIEPSDVEKKITSKTKAIIQVHLGGIAANITNSSFPIISDACQALGVFRGDYTCNSFQAIKQITTGDGGMLTVLNEKDYKKAKLLRWFGIDREKKIKNNWQCYKDRKMTFDIEVLGYKRQMTDLAAFMGLVGLKYYDEVIAYRKKLFDMYREAFKNLDGITLVDGEHNTYWLCTVLVQDRDNFARMLFENDIDSNLVQVRNDIYKIFGGERTNLPIMNEIENKYISIPLGMHVSEEEVQFICDVIRRGW